MPSAALQSVLAGRFSEVLRFREKAAQDPLPSGIPRLDFPRGAVTEIHGPPSSGRTTLLYSALAQATARDEVCALIDVDDTFDPASAAAAGILLDRMLWIRCGGNAEHALKTADLIVQAGGFGLIAMDLADTPPRTAGRISLASWFRLRHAVERTPAALVVLAQTLHAKSCSSLQLELRKEEVRWSGEQFGKLLRGMRVRAESAKHHQAQSAAFEVHR